MSEDWKLKEVSLIVEDYFQMLVKELQHQPINKAAHRRALQPQLKGRSEGSIEFKHQNISAALAELGQPFIIGYKPMKNYQQLLLDEVSKYLQSHFDELRPVFELFSSEIPAEGPSEVLDYARCLEGPPELSEKQRKPRAFQPIKINFLEKEQHNRLIGSEGERFALGYEKWRLARAGKQKLIKHISWVSKDLGDGTGYDILSKNEDGSTRYIEVKTTKLTKESPIYISANELAFAEQHSSQFCLYRVFNLEKGARLYILNGSYSRYCQLEPVSYCGTF